MSRPTLETYGVCRNLMLNERLLTLKFLNVTLKSLRTLSRNYQLEFRKKNWSNGELTFTEDKEEYEKNYGQETKDIVKENDRLLNNDYQVPYGRDEWPTLETLDEDLTNAIDNTQLWIAKYIELIGYYSLWRPNGDDYEDLSSMISDVNINRLNTERKNVRYQWADLPSDQSTREEIKEKVTEIKEEPTSPPRAMVVNFPLVSPPRRRRRIYSSSPRSSILLSNPLSTLVSSPRTPSRRSQQVLSQSPNLSVDAVEQDYFASLFPRSINSPRSPRENGYDNSNYYYDKKEKKQTNYEDLLRRVNKF